MPETFQMIHRQRDELLAKIEQLRKERDAFQRGVIDAVAENERLQAQWHDSDPEKRHNEILSLRTENERLRATLKPIVDAKNALSAALDNYGTAERWLKEQFLPAAAAAEVALIGTEQVSGE